MLHRSALTITRKQPYADWANNQAEEGTDPVPYTDELPRTVYLIPPTESPESTEELLDEWWETIFEEELASWSEDESTWPISMTREVFDLWFEVELTDLVVDLAPDEPLTAADVAMAAVDEVFHHCAWCGLELEPEGGRHVGFEVAERDRLGPWEGSVLPLPVDDERALMGVFTTRESDAAAAGEDLVFRACTSRCEKRIRHEAPRALRRLLDLLDREGPGDG